MARRDIWLEKLSNYIREMEEVLRTDKSLSKEARAEIEADIEGMRKSLYNLVFGERHE